MSNIQLQAALRRYKSEPSSENLRVANRLLQQAKLPSIGHVDDMRTMAQELHRQVWRTANRYDLQPEDMDRTTQRLYTLAQRYSNFDYGESLDRPDDDIEMAMDLFQRMPARCSIEDAQRAFPGDTWAQVWTAIQNIGGCEGCQQFVVGCRCAERCPDCGSADCVCGGYPMAVGGESAIWVDTNPVFCSCHGSGWCISDYDIVHQCPQHYTGQPYPEM